MRRLCTVGIALALAASEAAIAGAQSQFDSWTTESGLPQNSILDILQTRDGYLWAATEGGLVRFDGLRFTIFDRGTPGIGSQRIAALYEDRLGTLWAASAEGMLIRYRDGRFATFSTEAEPRFGSVRIEEDDAGALWVTGVGRIARFDGERLTNLGPNDLGHPVMAPPDVRYLYMDTWWRHDSSGLHAFVNGRVQEHPLSREWLGADVTGVNSDRQGNLWVRTAGAGVVRLGRGGPERLTTREGLPGNDLEGAFHDDGKGSIWFWEGHTQRLFRIRNGGHELIDLWGPRAFYVDREGSTWIGTLASGLHRLRETTATIYSRSEGLSLDRVYSILQDRNGATWIGTWDVGLNRYAGGLVTAYGLAEGLPSLRITSIYEDRRGRLWVGTQEGLTYLHAGQFRRYEHGTEFLSGSVWSMLEDRSATLWFATDQGLVESRDGRFTRYGAADGLSHDRVTALFEDRSGDLWIGAYRGVTRLRNGAFRAFAEPDGFIGNEVRSFHQDVDGVLWIGTYDGGLYRLADDRLTRFTRNQGLHDNGVFQILEDDDGHFWMGSNTGIARVSRHELNELAAGRRRSIVSVVFGTKDGLRSIEVNGGRHPAGWKAADGRLWFPTMGGIAVIDPSRITMNAALPRPVVEQVLVAGEAVALTAPVVVPSGAAAFEIRYTAPTFVKPEQVRFRYRVGGLADEWVEAGERRSVSFYRLPPGTYSFAVAATGQTGTWSPHEATLTIVVLPPFWATWWFRLLLVGVALAAAGGLHVERMRRLRSQQARRAVYLQELIDSQERERRRISNEMHDSIGHDLAMVRRHAQEAVEIADDAPVREELQQILTVADRIDREMKAIALGLRPYHLDKIGLTKSVEALVREVREVCGLDITAEIENVDRLFPSASHIHVYRIVQEALSNVVKHSNARRARVTVTHGPQQAEIRIDDDGVGVAVGWASPENAGFGLMGIRERAQLLGGVVSIARSHWGGASLVVTVRLDDTTDDEPIS